MISTKLWIHTAARYPMQCETQCLREGSSQQVKIQPNAFWMHPLQAIQFQNFICVLDLLIICSSLHVTLVFALTRIFLPHSQQFWLQLLAG